MLSFYGLEPITFPAFNKFARARICLYRGPHINAHMWALRIVELYSSTNRLPNLLNIRESITL